jgi:hypothetical protein
MNSNHYCIVCTIAAGLLAAVCIVVMNGGAAPVLG